jgi:hypothetical protein
MEAPSVTTMASGNLSLLITEDVSWESFPEQAQQFVDRFEGRVLKRMDTPVERMWVGLIKWRPFWLTFEDFPLGISLDSMNRLCNPVIREIYDSLKTETHNKRLQPIARENARSG